MSTVGNQWRQHTGKVLVLGGDNRSFLTVIRSLGRQNLHVHVGWFDPGCSAVHSKYVAKLHDMPLPSPNNDSWKHSLVAVLQRERFDLVIPCNDGAIIPLQMHRADLEQFASIYLLNEHAFKVSSDKFKTNELARTLRLPLPKEIRVSNPTEAEKILSEFQLPVVLKPRASVTEDNLVDRWYVRKAYNSEELTTYLKSLLSQGETLVQQNFIGTGVGVSVLAERGELLLAFQHVRTHEVISGGSSSYRRAVPLQKELLNATRRLMGALDYTGVAMVEFKVNFETGDWIFVEINGRFWGSLPLAVAAGADFPYYLYQLLVEGKRDFPWNYKTGIYCRNLLDDLRWMRHNLRLDRSDPTLATLPLWQVAKEVVNVLTLRERSDTFVIDDPKPGFVELAHFTYEMTTRAINQILLFLLSLPPIQKLYMRRAQRALSKAQAVLFVGKGDICRSPFAQYYAKTIFPESTEVMSTGYYPEEGRVCPKEAVDAAKELEVDLTVHRSTIITEEIVRQAQTILTFDEEDRRTLINRYPSAKPRIYRLGLFAQQEPINIRDPYGGNVSDFKSVYRTIMRALNSYMNSWSEEDR